MASQATNIMLWVLHCIGVSDAADGLQTAVMSRSGSRMLRAGGIAHGLFGRLR